MWIARCPLAALVCEQGFKPVEVLFIGWFTNPAHVFSHLGTFEFLHPCQQCFIAARIERHRQSVLWLDDMLDHDFCIGLYFAENTFTGIVSPCTARAL